MHCGFAICAAAANRVPADRLHRRINPPDAGRNEFRAIIMEFDSSLNSSMNSSLNSSRTLDAIGLTMWWEF